MAVEIANRRDITPGNGGGGNFVTRTFHSLTQFYHEVQDEMRKVYPEWEPQFVTDPHDVVHGRGRGEEGSEGDFDRGA